MTYMVKTNFTDKYDSKGGSFGGSKILKLVTPKFVFNYTSSQESKILLHPSQLVPQKSSQ